MTSRGGIGQSGDWMQAERPGFDSQQGLGLFSSPRHPDLVLGPTCPSVKWVVYVCSSCESLSQWSMASGNRLIDLYIFKENRRVVTFICDVVPAQPPSSLETHLRRLRSTILFRIS
jgi:hypothetical protein